MYFLLNKRLKNRNIELKLKIYHDYINKSDIYSKFLNEIGISYNNYSFRIDYIINLLNFYKFSSKYQFNIYFILKTAIFIYKSVILS